MKSVNVRGTAFGEGRAKIIVPVTASDTAGILREAEALRALPVDAVEWRADFFNRLREPGALTETLGALRQALGELPLLFTIRRQAEGGSSEVSPVSYCGCNLLAAASGCVDLVDVEALSFDAPDAAPHHIQELHDKGVAVIASRHFFDGTPDDGTMRCVLRRLRGTGADIVKLAVMPRTQADVLALLSASVHARAELDCPVITISMGALGQLSRVGCSLSGSCATFASGESASAPGQMPARELRSILDTLG